MDWIQIALIGGALLLILALIFRRYISALIYDYVVDAGFSFADNLLGGAGLIGLDFGDWLAAIIIFLKERKISNDFVAGIVAWEAANFIPFSLIPVVGEGIEIFFNFFPAVTVGRILFNKYGQAEKEVDKLRDDAAIARDLGMDVGDIDDVIDKARKLIDKGDPVDALREEERSDEEISSQLMEYVGGMMKDTEDIIRTAQSQEAPEEVIGILEEGIGGSSGLLQQAQDALDSEDFASALNATTAARGTIVGALQEFENQMQRYT